MATGFPDYSIGFTGIISVINGGTSLSTLTTGALMFGQGTAAVGLLPSVAQGKVLASQGVSLPPAYQDDIQISSIFLNQNANLDTPVLVKQHAGFTGHALEIQSSGAVVLAYIDYLGNISGASLALTTPLSVANGGTGQVTLAAGAILFGNTLAGVGSLASVSAGSVLVSQGVGIPPAYASDIQISSIYLNQNANNDTPVLIKQHAGFTGHALEIQSSGSVVLAFIDYLGNVSGTSLALTTPVPVTSGGTGQAACTAGQILTGTGANTANFLTPPGARCHNSANLSIPANVITALTFDTDDFNNGAVHNTGVNPSRLTAPKAGVYVISAAGYVVPVAGKSWIFQITLNNATALAVVSSAIDPAGDFYFTLGAIHHLAANDYIEFDALQNGAVAANVIAGANFSPTFGMQWVGP